MRLETTPEEHKRLSAALGQNTTTRPKSPARSSSTPSTARFPQESSAITRQSTAAELRRAFALHDRLQTQLRESEANLQSLRNRYADEQGLLVRPRLETLRNAI